MDTLHVEMKAMSAFDTVAERTNNSLALDILAHALQEMSFLHILATLVAINTSVCVRSLVTSCRKLLMTVGARILKANMIYIYSQIK